MNKERWLLCRYGGMGDALFLTAVAHQLAKRYIVDVATRDTTAPLLLNNPDIDTVYPVKRFGPPPAQRNPKNGHPVDLVNIDGGWVTVEALYERYKTDHAFRKYNVTNYRFVIESNTVHPDLGPSQNSDFINTYDTHLSWAGIDPERVPPIEKRPYYYVTDEERKWAEGVFDNFRKPVVMVQTFASSPARTYYRLSELITALGKEAGTLLVWYGNGWQVGKSPVTLPNNIEPIRASAALIEQADILVSADTCVSHLAEALDTMHLTYYSTVPAWSRSMYYQNEITVNSEVRYRGRICKCCAISRDCARRIREAWDSLTEKERALLHWLKPEHRQRLGLTHLPPPVPGPPPHERFGTSPQGFETQVQAAAQKYDGGRQLEAYCIESLDLVPHALAALRTVEVDNEN